MKYYVPSTFLKLFEYSLSANVRDYKVLKLYSPGPSLLLVQMRTPLGLIFHLNSKNDNMANRLGYICMDWHKYYYTDFRHSNKIDKAKSIETLYAKLIPDKPE